MKRSLSVVLVSLQLSCELGISMGTQSTVLEIVVCSRPMNRNVGFYFLTEGSCEACEKII
jgi:hypothetical protein